MHKLYKWFKGGVLALTAGLFGVAAYAYADSTPLWLSPSTIKVQKQVEVTTTPFSINGNIDCIQVDVNNCAVTTAFGSANTSGGVKLNNTGTYIPAVGFNSTQSNIIFIPNSNTVINWFSGPPYGLDFSFTKNFSSSINKITSGATTQYQLTHPPDNKLVDGSNHRLAADYESLSFSSDGKWMVVSVPNITMLRVNLDTFEVLPFAPGFNYTIGLSPSPKTAISNDGRYAVVASKDFARFNIYDLSTCGAVPSLINGPVSCQSRDLQPIMQQQVSGFTSISAVRFLGSDTLGIYAGFNVGTLKKLARFIANTGNNIHQVEYLSLGDSYISGEGAYSYQEGTDTGDNKCHISTKSYPYLINQSLNFNSFHSVACSGARIPDILDNSLDYQGQTKVKVKRKDRLEKASESLLTFQPGYINQLDFVTQYQPKTITLSIGGNDMGYSNIIKRCIGVDTCYGTYEDRVELVRQINRQLFPRLVATYQQIKNNAAPDMKFYAAGYPQTVFPGGDCALNVHLNADELVFAKQLTSYLNKIISLAASKAGIGYIDTENALAGHRLCETKSSDVAVNGLTAGNDIPNFLHGPIGNESYHPNQLGHQLLEQAVLNATSNLTQLMPVPDLNAAPPLEAGQEILNKPSSGRPINFTFYSEDIMDDAVDKQSPLTGAISGLDYSLKSSTNYQAQLQSDLINLGTYKTDSNGNLSFQAQIPASVPGGFHTLHVYGTNLAGEPIDVYKTIYVSGDQNGWCAENPSGQDNDKDGIDDSCDGYIADAPPTLEPEPVPAAENNNQSTAAQSPPTNSPVFAPTPAPGIIPPSQGLAQTSPEVVYIPEYPQVLPLLSQTNSIPESILQPAAQSPIPDVAVEFPTSSNLELAYLLTSASADNSTKNTDSTPKVLAASSDVISSRPHRDTGRLIMLMLLIFTIGLMLMLQKALKSRSL